MALTLKTILLPRPFKRAPQAAVRALRDETLYPSSRKAMLVAAWVLPLAALVWTLTDNDVLVDAMTDPFSSVGNVVFCTALVWASLWLYFILVAVVDELGQMLVDHADASLQRQLRESQQAMSKPLAKPTTLVTGTPMAMLPGDHAVTNDTQEKLRN